MLAFHPGEVAEDLEVVGEGQDPGKFDAKDVPVAHVGLGDFRVPIGVGVSCGHAHDAVSDVGVEKGRLGTGSFRLMLDAQLKGHAVFGIKAGGWDLELIGAAGIEARQVGQVRGPETLADATKERGGLAGQGIVHPG